MERLTERWNNFIRVKGCRTCYPSVWSKRAHMQNAIARLAAYEDSGLTPEEVMGLAKAANSNTSVRRR